MRLLARRQGFQAQAQVQKGSLIDEKTTSGQDFKRNKNLVLSNKLINIELPP